MTTEFASLCSGIEAASVAWESLGYEAKWFAEIEPFPSAVLAHRHPQVPNYGDMTKLVGRILSGAIAAPPVFVAGTPCQAFSVAGMREGLVDPRGALTIKYVEILDAADYVRTANGQAECVGVWENVPGALSDKENAFGCFLGALVGESQELQPPGGKWKDAGCVYGPRRTVAWRVLDAQYFGLAQRRRRVFVVASARSGFDPAAVLFEREGVRRDHPPRRGEKAGTAVGTLGGTSPGGGWRFGAYEAAGELLQLLDTIDRRWGGPSPVPEAPDNLLEYLSETGSDFDAEEPEHLQVLYNHLARLLCHAPNFHGRIIGGMCYVIHNPRNEIIDPDLDYLEMHPKLRGLLNNLAPTP
ncbi:site-specific DNA-cytosine methylase [Pseudomonas nitritireducens]|uniref:Site-specific DNA-cytosine methylase n=1 Tax=Pseudomonas nitroreducens TaxID=46680 RepID=A0A7W7P149_PSENT|nr:site-specific DNA-cytosine methylase [Pseudomonas nitritireducens]